MNCPKYVQNSCLRMGKTGPIKIFLVFHCNQTQTPKRFSSLTQLKSIPLNFYSRLHIYPLLFAKRFFSTILQKFLLYTCFYGTRFPSSLRTRFLSRLNPEFQVTSVNLQTLTFSVYLNLLQESFSRVTFLHYHQLMSRVQPVNTFFQNCCIIGHLPHE